MNPGNDSMAPEKVRDPCEKTIEQPLVGTQSNSYFGHPKHMHHLTL